MNKEVETNEKLKAILEGSKDVNRTLAVVYSYCDYYSANEKIYNVLHMMEYLLKKSDNITRELQYLYDNETNNEKDELIEKFKPIGDFNNVIIED